VYNNGTVLIQGAKFEEWCESNFEKVRDSLNRKGTPLQYTTAVHSLPGTMADNTRPKVQAEAEKGQVNLNYSVANTGNASPNVRLQSLNNSRSVNTSSVTSLSISGDDEYRSDFILDIDTSCNSGPIPASTNQHKLISTSKVRTSTPEHRPCQVASERKPVPFSATGPGPDNRRRTVNANLSNTSDNELCALLAQSFFDKISQLSKEGGGVDMADRVKQVERKILPLTSENENLKSERIQLTLQMEKLQQQIASKDKDIQSKARRITVLQDKLTSRRQSSDSKEREIQGLRKLKITEKLETARPSPS
jgi:hypothetical protein